MSNTSLTPLAPEVRTLARPSSGPLLAARGLIQRNADLQVAFVRAKAEGWDAARLADEIQPTLEAALEGSSEDVRQAGLYLADEYLQGGDAILLVSRETGKVLARITEEDVWKPPPVRREDGTLAQPLPRLRPDLEGFLVQWTFDRSREQQAVASLAPWAANTQTAKALSHAGRQGIVETIRENVTHLFERVGGSGRQFLDSFRLVGEDGTIPTGLTPLPRLTAFARTRMPLSDLRATNMRFDVLTSQQAVLASCWVTEMAHSLSMSHPNPRPFPYADLSPQALGEAPFWVAGGSLGYLCARWRLPAIPTEATTSLGLRPTVGLLQIHEGSYRVASREVFDRWEVAASVEYTFWVDWSRTTALRIEGEPVPVVVF